MMGSVIFFHPVDWWEVVDEGIFTVGPYKDQIGLELEIGYLDDHASSGPITAYFPQEIYEKLKEGIYKFKRTGHWDWCIIDKDGNVVYDSETTKRWIKDEEG